MQTWTSQCDTLSILSLNSNKKQNPPSSMWGPSVGRCTPSWPPSSCIPQSPSSPQTKSRSSSFSSFPPPRCRPVLWCFPLERWSGLEAQTSWGQLTGWLKVRSKTKVKQRGQKISQERPPPTPHTWLFMNPGGKMFKCYFSSLDKNLAWLTCSQTECWIFTFASETSKTWLYVSNRMQNVQWCVNYLNFDYVNIIYKYHQSNTFIKLHCVFSPYLYICTIQNKWSVKDFPFNSHIYVIYTSVFFWPFFV